MRHDPVKTIALIPLVVALLLAAPASGRTLLLGRSWQGRPIEAVEVGNPSGTRVLVVGCIHGNETAGIAIAHALERLSPRDLDLWIVPDLDRRGRQPIGHTRAGRRLHPRQRDGRNRDRARARTSLAARSRPLDRSRS